ncbi:ABC transporter ATP-binding protein [uncultured Winogradskyella sp.]|uniref:ABC transporter ATP-binding protein n=1 Tax=uncultured Winogradskyella sp. TaxID=395353 RepID=UPI00261E5271|nr:ABC transporter ATP-binding protein [uncultured Winogradskyella sp.]
MITLKNITKSYGKKNVLKNMSASFKKGQVYGIIGENGSGKTTLFRCISGLENYSGKIESDFKILKNHIGLLMTEPYFFSKITGKEYIRLLNNARQKKLTTIETNNIFNLPLNKYASTYSTGMKKKLALTAILLQGNDCFILDEPFNGVDIQSNIIITEIIHKLKKLDKTVIIASHIYSTLVETCDEIHHLKNGNFAKKVSKKDFGLLEAEMKEITIGTNVKKLEID